MTMVGLKVSWLSRLVLAALRPFGLFNTLLQFLKVFILNMWITLEHIANGWVQVSQILTWKIWFWQHPKDFSWKKWPKLARFGYITKLAKNTLVWFWWWILCMNLLLVVTCCCLVLDHPDLTRYICLINVNCLSILHQLFLKFFCFLPICSKL